MSAFFTYFMMANIAVSAGMAVILLVKKRLDKHISARWQYNLSLLAFALLVIPFIPSIFFASVSSFFNIRSWMPILGIEGATLASTTVSEVSGFTNGYAEGWLQDFAVSVDRLAPGYLLTVFTYIWIFGIVLFGALAIFNNRHLWLIKESVKPIDDKEIIALFLECRQAVCIKGSITLGSSILVKAPMTMGIFKSIIILPAGELSLKDARYAIMHELVHCKNKDIAINCIMFLFQMLYWFNPIVHFMFNEMRLDRELKCDAYVLDMLSGDLYVSYGEMLLNFVCTPPPAFCLAAKIGGSKQQIIKRVKHIASYSAESGFLKAKGICVFVLLGILVFMQIPIVSALAARDDSRFHFHGENVQHMNLAPFFGDFEGSFVMYDINAGIYTIHNRGLSETRVSPFSTYKIISTLIALETGMLDASNSSREWDGTVYPFESWNQDHNLASAMRYSVSWYFQDMDTQVGINGLRSYLSRLSYGNLNLSGGIEDFWNGSTLAISPLEQVMVLASLLQDSSIFEARHVDTLRDVLRLSERDGAVLLGKTGTGFVSGWVTGSYGWFIGYVETDDDVFAFATYIQGGDNARGSTAAEIALSILEDMGVY